MTRSLRLTVLTPERVLLDVDSATKIRAKLADDAWLSIYPNHAPLIAETLPGPLHYDTDTESGELAIAEGIVQVERDAVTVLTSGYQRGVAADATLHTDVTEDAEAARQFDRLAQQLLLSLRAQPPGGVPADSPADADAG